MVARIPVGSHLGIEFKSHDNSLAVQLSNKAVHNLLLQASREYPNETGGVLLGHYDAALHTATVTALGPWSRDSVKRAASFVRGSSGLNSFLRKLWLTTVCKEHYLGEWHTHPNSVPEPSRVDRETMWSIAKDEKALCPEPILLILAGSLKHVADVGVFIFPRGGREIQLLACLSDVLRLTAR